MSEYKDYGYNNNELRYAHKYLASSILNCLDKSKNKKILDVGCGNGALADFLISKGFDVYGIDASESGIKLANAKHEGRFFLQDLSSDEVPREISDKNFDTIISTEVVEHLYDPRKYIDFCKNTLLKNGKGELILSTPYHGYFKNLALALTGKLDSHFTALWDGGHIKFWSRKTLSLLLKEQNFDIKYFHGSGRFPYLLKSMIIKGSIQ
jgi:2-polyprenyl-3-methyl-5-hydroxy-6-metoxy-1,4-benzoquinol methylase